MSLTFLYIAENVCKPYFILDLCIVCNDEHTVTWFYVMTTSREQNEL